MAYYKDSDQEKPAYSQALHQAGQHHRKAPGMIQSYVNENAHPNSAGWRELNKLNDRITEVLDRVALTMRGQQVSRHKNEKLKPLEGLFDKEHYEQFMVNGRELVISVGFTSSKVLRLALTDITPKPEPVKEDSQDTPMLKTVHDDSFMGRRDRFEPDYIFGIKDPRELQYGNRDGLMSCEGYRDTIGTIGRTIETFAGKNGLAFYVQGKIAEDRLVYIFIDDDSAER